jgi:RNA polymerase sigma-70 factor, ECF subfamily
MRVSCYNTPTLWIITSKRAEEWWKGARVLADPEFISRLQGRDEAAILVLVDRYYAPIGRYLSRLLGDAQLAEDLTQETFLDAYVALPRLRAESHLGAWLFQIATNRARKHLRRQRIVRWLRLDPLRDQIAGHEERVARCDAVGAALAGLPDDYRIALLLQSWAGLTTAEIAQAIGKSEEATRMTLVRAKKRFRQLYEDDPDAL